MNLFKVCLCNFRSTLNFRKFMYYVCFPNSFCLVLLLCEYSRAVACPGISDWGGQENYFPRLMSVRFWGPALGPLAGCRGGMGPCRGSWGGAPGSSRYLATFTSKMTANLKQDLADLQIFALPDTLRQHKSLCGWGPYKKIQRHVLTRAIDKIQE